MALRQPKYLDTWCTVSFFIVYKNLLAKCIVSLHKVWTNLFLECFHGKWGRRGCNFNGEGVVGFSLYVILLSWNFVTGYRKRFYRIPPFPIFLLFHLFCIYWDWQGQKCKLECPKVYEINYIVTLITACTHPCGIYKHLYSQTRKNTFIATENPYLNEVFLKSKHFLFRHKRNFNPKVIFYF